MNFLSVLYAKAGIIVDGVTTLNNTATALTPATNDNSTNIATTGYVKNQNYYPYPTGTTSQYVRGDGSLATFSQGGGGGGSSVNYYLNGSVSQGTIGGNTYYEMSKNAIIGTNADFTINTNGYIAQFVTDAGDPALLNIPGGNWNFEMFFSASSGGGTPSFYVELYKYDGTTLTLIASGSTAPESITGGTATDLYITALAVPTTTLTLTDRLAVRVYVNHSGRTITLHTQNGHLCQVITTFTTGLTALNGLTAQVQNFAVGTSGTDFNISSVIDTHTFNLPTASATKRGALSSIDWSAFDAKVDFGDLSATSPLNYNGSGVFSIAQSSASTNGYLSSTDWTTFNNKIGGSGTVNYIAKFTSGSVVGNSIIYDNGTNVGIGTTSPGAKLEVASSSSGTTILVGRAVGNSNIKALSDNGGFLALDSAGIGNALILNHYTSDNIWMVTGGGNVLINTTTDAGYKLDVNGLARVSGQLSVYNNIYAEGNNNHLTLKSTSGSFSYLELTDSTSTGYLIKNTSLGTSNGALAGALYTYTDGNKAFQHVHAGTALFTILYDGNVGIGTNSPNAKLDVNGDANFRNSIYVDSINSYSGASVVKIQSGYGNVLIGTTTDAGYKFYVNGDAYLGAAYFSGTYSTFNSSYFTVNSNESVIGNNTSDIVGIAGNTMYFPGNGLVGIGTTNPLAKLHIVGEIRNSFGSGVGGSNYFNIIDGVSNGFRTTITTGNAITYTFHNGANAAVLNIVESGAATFSSTVNATSFTASNRTILTTGGVYDNATNGNNSGIGFGSGVLISTDGGGSYVAQNLGNATYPWNNITAAGYIKAGGDFFAQINGGIFFAGTGAYNSGVLSTNSGNDLILQSGGTGRAYLNSVGDFLVGVTSSIWSSTNRGIIQVNGVSQALIGLSVGGVGKGYLFHTGTNLYIDNTANGEMYLGTNGNTNLTISAAGAATFSSSVTAKRGIFQGSTGETLTAQGILGEWTANFRGAASTGNSYGLGVFAGTNASDIAFAVYNQAITSEYFKIKGDGTAFFGSSVTANSYIYSNGRTTTFGYRLPDWQIYNTSGGALAFNNYTTDFLSIASSGAATFSSSVTSGGNFELTSATTGLKSNVYDTNFYANSAAYWNVTTAAAVTAGALLFKQGYEGTTKGYVYWDSSGFGLLTNVGDWAVRANYGGSGSGGTLFGAWSSSGSFTATNFIGAGTGLTGTASGLSIGGNAATATSATTAGSATYASILSTTNQGIVGSTGLTTVSSTTEWSNYPIGYSAMFLAGQTATGAPSGNYGFFIKIANRDASGGWGGIWTDYSGGDTYVGNTTVGTSYANWYKLLSSTNYSSYALPLTGGTLTGNLNGTTSLFSTSVGTTSNGASAKWVTSQTANGNFIPYSFESDYGDHSWGIIARFRINQAGFDRPSIQFSNASTDNRWNIGYCYYDDQFRITQNMGYRNDNTTTDSWGTERFRIDTFGTLYANGNVILHAGNYNSYAPTLTGTGASGSWGISVTGNAATATNISNAGTVTLATATESNSIYITQPSYTTDTPVKLLNFAWYSDVWSMGNIRSGATPTNGFGIYLNGSEKFRFNSSGAAIFGSTITATNGIFNNAAGGSIGLKYGGTDDWVVGENSGAATRDFNIYNFNRTSIELSISRATGTATFNGRISTPVGWTTTGRNYSNEWIEFPNYTGLYSDNNSAHFYPNNGSYGSWKITGTRNAWAGLEFGSLSNGAVCLMVNPDSNSTGFYNTTYGWQFLWNNGELKLSKATYGGGTLAVVLDDTNYGSYALPLTGGTITGDLTVNNRVYVGTGGCYLEQVLIGGVYELQVVDSAGNKTVLS